MNDTATTTEQRRCGYTCGKRHDVDEMVEYPNNQFTCGPCWAMRIDREPSLLPRAQAYWRRTGK